jgi:long-chain acyl-CoA synthetase
MEWSRSHLGGLKAPKRIEIVDELPMTPTGKVLRREVRATLTGG